jgi:hypothetical protein
VPFSARFAIVTGRAGHGFDAGSQSVVAARPGRDARPPGGICPAWVIG